MSLQKTFSMPRADGGLGLILEYSVSWLDISLIWLEIGNFGLKAPSISRMLLVSVLERFVAKELSPKISSIIF
jgi:hypothetical protein